MSVNKVILLGHLGKDPELRVTASGANVASFSLATSERRKDQSGEWKDAVEWHNVVVFGKTADNACKFLKKGSQVYVEGKIHTRKWQDKEGKDRYTTEITGEVLKFVGKKEAGERAQTNAYPKEVDSGAYQGSESNMQDDDIPF